jgi:hypothetical protein
MLTKPRTVCFCQPVIFTISANVTPFARFIIAITSAFLLLRLGWSCAFPVAWAFLLAFFFPACACSLGRSALVFSPLAGLWRLGAPYFLLAPLFEAAGSGLFRSGGGFVGGFCVGHVRSSFSARGSRMTIHHSEPTGMQVELWPAR